MTSPAGYDPLGELRVRSDVAREYRDLFGDKAVNERTVNVEALIVEMSREHQPEFARLLDRRQAFQRDVAEGRASYGFAAPETVVEDVDGRRASAAEVRRGMLDGFLGRDTPERWRLNGGLPAPAEVLRPGLQGTGPADDLGMAIGALNAGGYGASSWMWDWEDAGNDYGDKLYRAWRNLRELLSGEWEGRTYRHPEKGKEYALRCPRGEWPVVFHRVPGLHLVNRQMLLDGRRVPAMVPALVLHALNNYDAQRAAGSGIYFYVPKIETPEEALLVARLLRHLEERIGVPRGTLKIEMLNERARYAAFQELIMWVVRDWLIGPNVGRWDYINSRIEMLKDAPDGVFPDPHTVGMTEPTMTEYTRRNAVLSILVGGFPIGGMSAVMKKPKAQAEVNERALRSIWFDKLRERLTGLVVHEGESYDAYRQSWVATTDQECVRAGAEPLQADVEALGDLVGRTSDGERAQLGRLGLVDEEGAVRPLALAARDLAPEALFSNAARERLFRRPDGPISEEGLRYAIYMASEYVFQQLNGNNAAAIEDYLTGTRLMNDFATYEIFWHWLWTVLHHRAALTEDGSSTARGDRVTPGLVRRLLDERRRDVDEYFAEQDRRGVKSRFDRGKAGLTMEILERQLLHPRWIVWGSRVLDSVKEEPEPRVRAILDAVFSESREAAERAVGAGEAAAAAMAAYDFVYDVFGEGVFEDGVFEDGA